MPLPHHRPHDPGPHDEDTDDTAVKAPPRRPAGVRRRLVGVDHAPTGAVPVARAGRRAAASVLAACLMVGCTGTQPVAAPASEVPTGATGAAGASAPAASEACGPVETPALQGGSHLLADRPPPVPYTSTPPTSGWHASGAFTINVRGPSEALSEPQQVSVLEVGGVVATYRDLPQEDRGALEETATMAYPGRVAVTPYDRLAPGEVAFTAWGAVQRCDGLDLDALRAFVETYADPEPDAPGEH